MAHGTSDVLSQSAHSAEFQSSVRPLKSSLPSGFSSMTEIKAVRHNSQVPIKGDHSLLTSTQSVPFSQTFVAPSDFDMRFALHPRGRDSVHPVHREVMPSQVSSAGQRRANEMLRSGADDGVGDDRHVIDRPLGTQTDSSSRRDPNQRELMPAHAMRQAEFTDLSELNVDVDESSEGTCHVFRRACFRMASSFFPSLLRSLEYEMDEMVPVSSPANRTLRARMDLDYGQTGPGPIPVHSGNAKSTQKEDTGS